MKLFKTSNGINMVECQPYNWEVSYKYRKTTNPRLMGVTDNGNPLVFSIFIGNMGDSRSIIFNPLRKLLFISDIVISVSTFEEASEMVKNIAISMGKIEIGDDFDELVEYTYVPSKEYSIYRYVPISENYKDVDIDIRVDFNILYEKYNENLRLEKLDSLNK